MECYVPNQHHQCSLLLPKLCSILGGSLSMSYRLGIEARSRRRIIRTSGPPIERHEQSENERNCHEPQDSVGGQTLLPRAKARLDISSRLVFFKWTVGIRGALGAAPVVCGIVGHQGKNGGGGGGGKSSMEQNAATAGGGTDGGGRIGTWLRRRQDKKLRLKRDRKAHFSNPAKEQL